MFKLPYFLIGTLEFIVVVIRLGSQMSKIVINLHYENLPMQ